MRLGDYPCRVVGGTKAALAYGQELIYERHRHRFEFNNDYRAAFAASPMNLSGVHLERDLVEIVELPEHPFFIGVQFHPEFKSQPLAPHPIFSGFVHAALAHKRPEQNGNTDRKTERSMA
jgi:CTP synthase